MPKKENNLVPVCDRCETKYDESVHIPLLLECGHSFCKPCISTIRKSASIKCPKCSRPIPEKGAIPINHLVLQCLSMNKKLFEKTEDLYLKLSKVGAKKEKKMEKEEEKKEDVYLRPSQCCECWCKGDQNSLKVCLNCSNLVVDKEKNKPVRFFFVCQSCSFVKHRNHGFQNFVTLSSYIHNIVSSMKILDTNMLKLNAIVKKSWDKVVESRNLIKQLGDNMLTSTSSDSQQKIYSEIDELMMKMNKLAVKSIETMADNFEVLMDKKSDTFDPDPESQGEEEPEEPKKPPIPVRRTRMNQDTVSMKL